MTTKRDMESNSKETVIKILQIVQRRLRQMGFYPKQQQNTGKVFGKRQSWEIAYAVVCTSLVGLFPFFGAKNREDYLYAVFILSAAIGITVSLISLTTKNDKIFDAIEMGEKLLTDG